MGAAGAAPCARGLTGVSAGRLAYRDRIGRLEAGWRSRFILTLHSPLETVANLRRARTVVFDGLVFSTDETFDGAGL